LRQLADGRGGGYPAGGSNAHPVPEMFAKTDLAGVDPIFHPLVRLEPLTAGTFRIMTAAIFAGHRGRG